MHAHHGDEHRVRTESDSMGKVSIPEHAYWGAQTQRAVENFSVSPYRIDSAMLYALALVKKHAAKVNVKLGLLEKKIGTAIMTAATEIADQQWDDHFPVDVFQTGSGTSWNMNINEVIANRANEILGSARGTRHPVHPNDHVNRGQSSNDVIPTALHIACRVQSRDTHDALNKLYKSLHIKALKFKSVIKLGRTHLQDAVPITLGHEFSSYAAQIKYGIRRLCQAHHALEGLALGGTAVGTGINTHPQFGDMVIDAIKKETHIPFLPAENRFEAIASRDAQVELMNVLSTIAGSLMKIAEDLRLLASGPRGGFGEIILPSLQPGSSIMPGKVNPVIPEMVLQVAAFIIGKAASVQAAGHIAPLELNMAHPLIAHETLTSLKILSNTARTFARNCIDGIQADEERCAYWLQWSIALVTPLAIEIGYDKAAEIAHKAYREKRTVRDVASETLSEAQLNRLLDPKTMLDNTNK